MFNIGQIRADQLIRVWWDADCPIAASQVLQSPSEGRSINLSVTGAWNGAHL